MHGFSSGMPLIIDSEIVKEASMLFKKAVYNPNKIFYFGETIIASSYSKKKLLQENSFAQRKNCKRNGL